MYDQTCLDEKKTLDEILEFFKGHTTVKAVRIVKDKKTKKSTGRAYMELGSEKDATELADKKTVKWGENEIKIVKKSVQLLFTKNCLSHIPIFI